MYFRELGDNRDLSHQRNFFGSVWKLFVMDEAIVIWNASDDSRRFLMIKRDLTESWSPECV